MQISDALVEGGRISGDLGTQHQGEGSSRYYDASLSLFKQILDHDIILIS